MRKQITLLLIIYLLLLSSFTFAPASSQEYTTSIADDTPPKWATGNFSSCRIVYNNIEFYSIFGLILFPIPEGIGLTEVSGYMKGFYSDRLIGKIEGDFYNSTVNNISMNHLKVRTIKYDSLRTDFLLFGTISTNQGVSPILGYGEFFDEYSGFYFEFYLKNCAFIHIDSFYSKL